MKHAFPICCLVSFVLCSAHFGGTALAQPVQRLVDAVAPGALGVLLVGSPSSEALQVRAGLVQDLRAKGWNARGISLGEAVSGEGPSPQQADSICRGQQVTALVIVRISTSKPEQITARFQDCQGRPIVHEPSRLSPALATAAVSVPPVAPSSLELRMFQLLTIPGPGFYDVIGEPGLAISYRRRRLGRALAGSFGAATLAVGGTWFLAPLLLSGVRNPWLGSGEPQPFRAKDHPEPLLLMGAGATLVLGAVVVDSDPLTPQAKSELLRKRLTASPGTSAFRSVRIAPAWFGSAGGVALSARL